MISAGDFRNGVTFEEDGQVLQVVEFQHVKPGKGAAFVRTKTKNVITGSITEKSYNPSAKFPTAFIERKDMDFSYSDGDLYYFMDPETFDMVPINESDLPDAFKFVKENMTCQVLSYKGKVFGLTARTSSNSKSPTRSPVLPATPLPTRSNPLPSKPVLKSASRCSSTRAKSFRSTPVPASTWAAHKSQNKHTQTKQKPVKEKERTPT